MSALVTGAAAGEQEQGRGLRVLQCVATPVGEASCSWSLALVGAFPEYIMRTI